MLINIKEVPIHESYTSKYWSIKVVETHDTEIVKYKMMGMVGDTSVIEIGKA